MAVSQSRLRANAKWAAKTYSQIGLRVRKDGDITKETIEEYAMAKGESLNQYILTAVQQRMAREDAIRRADID